MCIDDKNYNYSKHKRDNLNLVFLYTCWFFGAVFLVYNTA